jgi:cytochrome P450
MPRVAGPSIPRAIWELGLLFRPLDCLENCARRYGDPFRVGGRRAPPAVYFSHPTAIQQILTADPAQYEPRRGDRIRRFLHGDNALQYLTGERHLQQRRLLAPPLHGERLRGYGQLVRDITESITQRWEPGRSFLLRPAMQELTLRVISRVVFDLDEGPRLRDLRERLRVLVDSATGPWSILALSWSSLRGIGRWGPWERLASRRRDLDRLTLEAIRERRAHPPGTGVLGVLTAARDEAGRPMTDQEVRDELMALLFAGHETTASALTWALYCVHQQPEVEAKLRAELERLADGAGPSEIAQLPYLTAVCQETLRLYSGVVAVVRVPKAPMDVMGYRLEAGTQVIPCFYLTHRREDLYPEPTRFRPERFLERQYSAYEYLPFGAGPRRCIGMAFAQFEMKIALATILSRRRLTLPDRRPVKPVRRGVFAGPPDGIRLAVEESRTRVIGPPGAATFRPC